MGVRTVTYAGGINADTNRGPSDAIWGSCPWSELQQEPRLGTAFVDEFVGFPSGGVYNGERTIGQWATWIGNNSGAVVGTGADTTNLPLEGGVLGLYGGTTAIDITLAATQSAFRLVSPASGYPLAGKLWFECSIAVSSVTSAYGDLFCGLMDTGDAGTRITSAASLCFSATNTIKTTTSMGGCLGFWKRATTNPTDACIVHNVNAGTAQVLGSTSDILKLSTNYAGGAMAALATTSGVPTTIGSTAGTCFIKLGFVFDPNAYTRRVVTALSGQTAGAVTRGLVDFYVNGKRIPVFYDSAILQAATFPTSFMSPVIGYRSGGTGAMIAYVDFVRVAQLANS